jgi:hypothetical protein
MTRALPKEVCRIGVADRVTLLPFGGVQLLAQCRHAQCTDECPLLGAQRTLTQPLLTNLDL